LGGLLLPLKIKDKDDGANHTFVWVGVTVGDCKAFHYSKATKVVTDLTEGNRKVIRTLITMKCILISLQYRMYTMQRIVEVE
jgi:hypothetical protein